MLGEAQAWKLLAARDPSEVCERAAVVFVAEAGGYQVPVFGSRITVDPSAQTMTGSCEESELPLTKNAYFSRLSVLHYLLGAQKIAPSGRLLKPEELKTGQFYAQGSHLLPLDRVAARFSRDPEGFTAQAGRFGGRPQTFGDVATVLMPFPRVPVTLILWLEDDEFPARCSLLFDDTCELHLPADMLWSVAMLCALVMLRQ